MISGVGIDLVNINRIEALLNKYGEKFIKRVLSEEEIADLSPLRAESIAGRWALKEAFWKALNLTLFFSPREVGFFSGKKNEVKIYSKRIEEIIEERNIENIKFSLSHEGGLAVAIVIVEGGKK